MFPIAFGDDFNCSIDHLDGGLFVNCVRRHRHPGSPFFGVSHGVVRQHLVIKVWENRKINQAQRFIATTTGTGGRSPADELLPDAGGYHHAPGTQAHVDRTQGR